MLIVSNVEALLKETVAPTHQISDPAERDLGLRI